MIYTKTWQYRNLGESFLFFTAKFAVQINLNIEKIYFDDIKSDTQQGLSVVFRASLRVMRNRMRTARERTSVVEARAQIGTKLNEDIRMKPKNPDFLKSAYRKIRIFLKCGRPHVGRSLGSLQIRAKVDVLSVGGSSGDGIHWAPKQFESIHFQLHTLQTMASLQGRILQIQSLSFKDGARRYGVMVVGSRVCVTPRVRRPRAC